MVARAEEVDRVLGTDTSVLPYQQIQGLTYVNQILNETLRLWPTVAAFTRYPYRRQGRAVSDAQGSSITGFTIMLHRDPSVWGADAEEYNRHFRPETRSQIPPKRIQAVRFGSAGLHRAPVRHAGSDARPRHAAATLRVRRLPEL